MSLWLKRKLAYFPEIKKPEFLASQQQIQVFIFKDNIFLLYFQGKMIKKSVFFMIPPQVK